MIMKRNLMSAHLLCIPRDDDGCALLKAEYIFANHSVFANIDL